MLLTCALIFWVNAVRAVSPTIPLHVSNGVPQSPLATNANSYLETLYTPTARFNVLSQFKYTASPSNALVLTVNACGAFQLCLEVPELGWVSPVDGNLLTATNSFRIPGQTNSVPLVDFVATGNINAFQSGFERYRNGQQVRSGNDFFYSNGGYLAEYNGRWRFLDQRVLHSTSPFSYNWDTTNSIGGAQQLFSSSSIALRYPTNSIVTNYALFTSWLISLDHKIFSDGKVNFFFLDGTTIYGNGAMNYPAEVLTSNALAIFTPQNIASYFYPNGKPLKSEDAPYRGKVFDENGAEVPSIFNKFTWSTGEIGIQANEISDYVYILQRETNVFLEATHVVIQHREKPALSLPAVDTDKTVRFSLFPPEASEKFQLQYTADLTNWISPDFWRSSSGTINLPILWTDTNTVTSPQRFYRVLLPTN